jgi:hypothetical protein
VCVCVYSRLFHKSYFRAIVLVILDICDAFFNSAILGKADFTVLVQVVDLQDVNYALDVETGVDGGPRGFRFY